MDLDVILNIKNPIDDPKTIEKIVSAFSKTAYAKSGYLYENLLRTADKGTSIDKMSRDMFYAKLFNKWNDNVCNMSREEFMTLNRQGRLGSDFIKLHNYVAQRNIQSFFGYGDSIQLIRDVMKSDDEELKNAIDRYRPDKQQSGWLHVSSRVLSLKKESDFDIKHRLYVNLDNCDLYKFALAFFNRCDSKKIPFYFKFHSGDLFNIDDSMVIYSSTENLEKYLMVLNEIKTDYPELVSRVKFPPVLAGVIDGWIGYGAEVEAKYNGESQSYTSIRSTLLYEVLTETTRNWVKEHMNDKINIDGKEWLVRDYISSRSSDFLIDRVKSFSRNTVDYFNSEEFKKSLVTNVGFAVPGILDRLYLGNDHNKPYPHFKVQVGSNEYHLIKDDIEKAVISITPDILRNDPNFSDTIKDKIKSQQERFFIDRDNFCFDINTRKEIQEYINSKSQVDNNNFNHDLHKMFKDNIENENVIEEVNTLKKK